MMASDTVTMALMKCVSCCVGGGGIGEEGGINSPFFDVVLMRYFI